jgi:hypothetical protein
LVTGKLSISINLINLAWKSDLWNKNKLENVHMA